MEGAGWHSQADYGWGIADGDKWPSRARPACDGPGIAIIIAAGGRLGSYVRTLDPRTAWEGQRVGSMHACMHVRKRDHGAHGPAARDGAPGPVAPAVASKGAGACLFQALSPGHRGP